MFAILYGVLALVGLCAGLVIAARARELCWRAPVDHELLDRALREARSDATSSALLARTLEPSWVAELLRVGAQARAEGQPADDAIDEALMDLRARTTHSLLTVNVLGRVAPPLAFMAAIVTMATALRHDAGLLSLQKGLAESIAVNQAVLAIATGTTISLVCRFAIDLLSRRGARLLGDLQRAVALLDELRAAT